MQILQVVVLALATVSFLGGRAAANDDAKPITSSVDRKLHGLFHHSNGIRGSGKNTSDNKSGEATNIATSRNLVIGCYETYKDGTVPNRPTYVLDQSVSAKVKSTLNNYKCISTFWCGVSGYGPGTPGQVLAWVKEEATCSSSVLPPDPIAPPHWNGVGCPLPYRTNSDYMGLEVVSYEFRVYRCKAWPQNLYCGMESWQPGVSYHWPGAWDMIGSCVPTGIPIGKPSASPSGAPSLKPSQSPSDVPSSEPSQSPSDAPSSKPSISPSSNPSKSPSDAPSSNPTISFKPTQSPSDAPSPNPTISFKPSQSPSDAPSWTPSQSPSDVPSSKPSISPTSKPSQSPSDEPSSKPSQSPSDVPSSKPSISPSLKPSQSPSDAPSFKPSISFKPSQSPTDAPSSKPSQSSSDNPTSKPSISSSSKPSQSPSDEPSSKPSISPSTKPSQSPSDAPSSKPSQSPSHAPSSKPSQSPSHAPSSKSVTTTRDNEWLVSHNNRRKQWHEKYGKLYIPLKWSQALKEESQVWADKLVMDCSIQHDYTHEYGENLALDYGGSSTTTLAEDVLERWVEDEANLVPPGNGHRTQVLWRATKYVGCADASITHNGGPGKCRVQVCRYTKPGNCELGTPTPGDWWLEPMLMDDSSCGDKCPPDGCT